MLFKKLSIPCHQIIYFSLPLQERQTVFQPASPNLLMDPLSTVLRNSFRKTYPVSGIKKMSHPLQSRDMHTFRQAPVKLFGKPNNTEAFISNTSPLK